MPVTRTSPDRLPHRPPAPEELVGLLADETRRSIVAALVDGRRTVDELAARSRGTTRELLEQLGRLEAAGMVARDEGVCTLVADVFERSVRAAATERLGPLNDKHTQLARRYFFRNRLVGMPSEPWAVRVVLDLIAEDFQPGEIYSEREVNTVLFGWYGDWALLRRLLVDHGYLARRHGHYHRIDARQSSAAQETTPQEAVPAD